VRQNPSLALRACVNPTILPTPAAAGTARAIWRRRRWRCESPTRPPPRPRLGLPPHIAKTPVMCVRGILREGRAKPAVKGSADIPFPQTHPSRPAPEVHRVHRILPRRPAGCGAQPRPKALVAVVMELRHFANEQDEDFLHEIGRILPSQTGAARPVEEQRRVQTDETIPGFFGAGASQSFQQAGGGRVHGRPRQERNGAAREG
jgi:hypothetical protein